MDSIGDSVKDITQSPVAIVENAISETQRSSFIDTKATRITAVAFLDTSGIRRISALRQVL